MKDWRCLQGEELPPELPVSVIDERMTNLGQGGRPLRLSQPRKGKGELVES